MKKPVLSLEEPEPKKASRADRPPTEGFVTVVDGHFKSEFDSAEAAEAAGRKLKSAYPMLQIEIYDAATKVVELEHLALWERTGRPGAICRVGKAQRAHHSRMSQIDGGHAEPVIGRAFARPVGFAHPTKRRAIPPRPLHAA